MKAPTLAVRSGDRKVQRVLSARPDSADFRDRLFEPTLVEVPPRIELADYRAHGIPVLDQGREGACTGFALATVANYLLARRRVAPDRAPVSPRMLFEMARRYDEWPGEAYEWSSARGAMKGWHKHGVCSAAQWSAAEAGALTEARSRDALQRPLGAYLRVNHQDLVALHSALAETGILFASAGVHTGWDDVDTEGRIPWRTAVTGGHAFAIVAYDADGFWIQNSWGEGWGLQGFAHLGYDDWLANATDVWVARLGAPVVLRGAEAAATANAPTAGRSASYVHAELRPHVVSLGNDGRLKKQGEYATSEADLRELFEVDLPRTTGAWPVRHVLLYAHGGLVDEASAIQRVADWRGSMLESHIYPIALVWHSDYLSTLAHILQDAWRQRMPEGGAGGPMRDFLLERVDGTLELLARGLTGKASWDEMKENALAASAPGGGVRLALAHLVELAQRLDVRVHVAGHSAGAVLLAPLVRLLTAHGRIADGLLRGQQGLGLPLATCTLWAPACTTALFRQAYLPALQAGGIRRLALFALTDKAERDDHVAGLYRKSLLYLISRAFEASPFGPGTPLLGMQHGLAQEPDLAELFTGGAADLVLAPNSAPEGSVFASRAAHHCAFDDDEATVTALIRRVLQDSEGAQPPAPLPLRFHPARSALRKRREALGDVRTP